MSDPREVEMKLDLSGPEAPAAARKAIKALGLGAGKRQTLSSVYFDTSDHALQKHGLSLRVRSTKAGKVQTVKTAKPGAGGLFDRSEWESAIDGSEPEPDVWAKTPVGDLLPKDAPLKPLFETVVDRTAWTVTVGRSILEIALDHGRVVAGAKSRGFAELELELKRGDAADLFEFARRLDEKQPLKLGVLTKSERGYALVAGKKPHAFKAEPVGLRRGVPADEAFRRIAHACLRQFRRNETSLIEKRRVESLHEARVGMRRLRSALSLFKDLVADEASPGLKEALREVSRILGEARNVDVYLERAVLPEREAAAEEPGITAFVDKVRTLREQAYDRALAALDAATFRRLMIDLLAWIETGPWTTDHDQWRTRLRARPIEAVASEILDRRFKKIRKTGRHLADLDPVARHRVRIDAKKLRYAAEFFAGLIEGKAERTRFEAFLKSMKAFQELLGDLNDLHTGHELALDLARKTDLTDARAAQSLFAMGHLSGEQDERVATLLVEAGKVFADFASQPKFWRDWAG